MAAYQWELLSEIVFFFEFFFTFFFFFFLLLFLFYTPSFFFDYVDEVKERLGVGSFGAVYHVEDLNNLNEDKAMKIFFRGGKKVY
jgi:hypothetical protein